MNYAQILNFELIMLNSLPIVEKQISTTAILQTWIKKGLAAWGDILDSYIWNYGISILLNIL